MQENVKNNEGSAVRGGDMGKEDVLLKTEKEPEGEEKNEGTVISDGVGKENEDISKERKKGEEKAKTILAYYPEHVIIGLSLGLIVCVCAFSYGIVCLCYVTFGNRPEPWPGQINNSTQGKCDGS